MDKIKKIKQEQQYKDYVKEKTPVHNVWLNMANCKACQRMTAAAGLRCSLFWSASY